MNTDSFRFKIGNFDCIAVNDGSLLYTDPAPLHFVNAPKEELRMGLLEYNIQLEQWTEWISPLICLFIQTSDHCVMVDTGLGSVDFGPDAGKLLPHLRAEGIEPEDIDTVIISHAHGDHVGGNTNSAGQAAFPRARYYMRKDEWDFWTSDKTLANPKYEWMAEFVNKSLLPIQDRFELLDQDIEVVPGVNTLFAPGHTPGNMAVVITSNGQELLYLGDIFAHPLHLEHPDWYLEPDFQPSQSASTRRWLFNRAAVDQTLALAFHLDFPGLGYIYQQQGNWKWHPIYNMK